MPATVVEVGLNQSEVLITEGTATEAIICAEVTSGTLQRTVTVFLETSTSSGSGNLNAKQNNDRR